MTLREWLAAEGRSLKWLSAETGISYRTLLRYTSERDDERRAPSIADALVIVEKTGGAVRLEDLAGERKTGHGATACQPDAAVKGVEAAE